MHPELAEAVAGLACCQISEEGAEGLHRDLKRIGEVAKATTLSWGSATHCLEQNIAIVEATLNLPGGEALFCAEWQRYKRILQPPGSKRRSLRPRRLTTTAFKHRCSVPWRPCCLAVGSVALLATGTCILVCAVLNTSFSVLVSFWGAPPEGGALCKHV